MTMADFVKSEGLEYSRKRITEFIDYYVLVDKLCIKSVPVATFPTERAIRPLKKLNDKQQQEVWEVLQEQPKITQSYVEQVVEDYLVDEAQPKTKKGKSDKRVFNYTNENIDWAKWSWNPVTGCKHGCKYCYARDIANHRFGGFEPKEHLHRLAAPRLTRIPDSKKDEPGIHNVFVCSMADLFGDWVPDEWIEKVLNAVRDNPQWNYLFLTKNPKRLSGIDWPEQAWVGTTVDCQARVEPAEEAFKNVNANVKFVSVEPFQEQLEFHHLDRFDWVIIGGRSKSSGMAAGQPESIWVERLVWQARKAKCKVYFKPNLKYGPKEYPERRQAC
jgi:protein gp37